MILSKDHTHNSRSQLIFRHLREKYLSTRIIFSSCFFEEMFLVLHAAALFCKKKCGGRSRLGARVPLSVVRLRTADGCSFRSLPGTPKSEKDLITAALPYYRAPLRLATAQVRTHRAPGGAGARDARPQRDAAPRGHRPRRRAPSARRRRCGSRRRGPRRPWRSRTGQRTVTGSPPLRGCGFIVECIGRLKLP